jgi:hypothetical protein
MVGFSAAVFVEAGQDQTSRSAASIPMLQNVIKDYMFYVAMPRASAGSAAMG